MFRVEWIQSALDDLARLWTSASASLRQSLTNAAHLLDQELSEDPYRSSEAREETEDRILFIFPLAAEIEIDLAQRIVWVLHVWQFRRRGEPAT